MFSNLQDHTWPSRLATLGFVYHNTYEWEIFTETSKPTKEMVESLGTPMMDLWWQHLVVSELSTRPSKSCKKMGTRLFFTAPKVGK